VGARRGGDDYRYYLVLNEEMARAGAHGPGFSVHNDINGQYFRRLMTAVTGDDFIVNCQKTFISNGQLTRLNS